ncbi:MAG: CRISPR-associated endoribonuclease Cas6 [Ignavibacteriales bacterium]
MKIRGFLLRLILRLKTEDSYVSINHNYALSGAIYKLLQFGSPAFADFLHEKGYELKDRKFKLFTFALKLDKYEIQNGAFRLNSKYASLFITSPMIEGFIKNFILGTFTHQNIEIISERIPTRFKINTAELIPEPEYRSEMKFKLLSPLVVSQAKMFNGNFSPYYFRINDDISELNRIFNNNLISKYEIVENKKYEGEGIKLNWDEKYIQAAIANRKRLTKKISILKELHNPIEIVGINCPFNLTGDPKLIRTGYESGFGEKNSMGFGLAEVSSY